jgi:COX assembly protein 1
MEMAPAITSEPQTAPFPAPRQPQNLRNPLPLSATQEAQVRDLYYKRVRSRCADEIKGTLPH